MASTESAKSVPVWAARARELDLLILRVAAEVPGFVEKLDNGYAAGAGGCAVWTGGVDGDGYGGFSLPASVAGYTAGGSRVKVRAHRARFVLAHGRPVGYGLELDHDPCGNVLCGNVEHLVERTGGMNSRRAITGTLDLCRSEWHSLGEGNVHPSSTAVGVARCRECIRIRTAVQTLCIATAAVHLGVTQSAYVAAHGRSLRAALESVEWNRDLLVIALSRRVGVLDLAVASTFSGLAGALAREAFVVSYLGLDAFSPWGSVAGLPVEDVAA